MLKSKHFEETYPLEDVPRTNLGKESLEEHASLISNYYKKEVKTNSRRTIMKSLDLSYKNILKGYNYIDEEIRSKKEVVPASEWLIDNLYLIEKEYKDIRHNMPMEYYKNLPVIHRGLLKGFPRIYYIASELVAHTDGRINESSIINFVNAYQENTILNSGELWALPIMLRISLIQNVSKLTGEIIDAEEEKKQAEELGDKLISATEKNSLSIELKKLEETNLDVTATFVERLLKHLRENGVDDNEIYKFIDVKMEEAGTSIEKAVALEHQKQAIFQLSMGNSVNSIREVEALNWRETFEKLSYVEQVLGSDPSGIYIKMDFETKDQYRHSIESIAKTYNVSESYAAKKSIQCAFLESENNLDTNKTNDYKKHVGYYLIDEGITILEHTIAERKHRRIYLLRKLQSIGVKSYISLTIGATLLIIISILSIYYKTTKDISIIDLLITFIALIIPISEIVVSTFNWSINHLIKPRFVPKLEFKDGIPEEASTIVVIPTLLNSEKRVHDLISDMEVYYLGNSEPNIYFTLLGDLKDSSEEKVEEDDSINDFAIKEIKALNCKYCTNGVDIFYFLNRYRQFNEKQGIWMGFERKRGKLMEFNALLRGGLNTSYNVFSGSIEPLMKARYVITLDADTKIPRDSAKHLIGAMEHVLNKPHMDLVNKKVLRGYGIMQPRVIVGTISANKTIFSKIFSGETGIDMYSNAISDVYQDLFGEGIFTGKGIYNIDVFNSMLKDEIPENSVLSHDLLEGCYTRCALVTDIELIDGYPAYYNSSSMRLHRWVRGDWQLLPWLFKRSSLNLLSKWKILDNLRRSILAPSIIILAFLSFTVLKGTPEKWLLIAILAVVCPILFDVSEAVISPVRGISLSGEMENGKIVIEQFFLIFAFLTYQAYLMLDAIIRTLYRLLFSKRNMLEWQTAADVELKSRKDIIGYIKNMWPGSLISIFILYLAVNKSLGLGLFMLPSSIIWTLSPLVAFYISKERKITSFVPKEEQDIFLRRISRKTWTYFEDFVNSEKSWLCPDNFQEDPPIGIAFRTSPTNLGMGLTSNIVAYDMGYISFIEFIERTDSIITNMESLKRYKGHFYNWYDIKTKEPLRPLYVSTVDSGNLAGYIWLLTESIKEYLKENYLSKRQMKGMYDLVLIAEEELRQKSNHKDVYTQSLIELKKDKIDLLTWKSILIGLWSRIREMKKDNTTNETYWNKKLERKVSNSLGELQRLFPQLELAFESEAFEDSIFKKLDLPIYTNKIVSMPKDMEDLLTKLEAIQRDDDKRLVKDIISQLKESQREAENLISRSYALIKRLEDMAQTMDFSIVYDKKRQLFSIGYDLEKEDLINSYYDLLASEARQASFVAIAKGDVEQKHWFKLGRAMTMMDKNKGLVSWSGTMFEYFMPLLIMRDYPDTLLNETYRAVVEKQKKYCLDRRIPWGISESAFYSFDINNNYQYKAFGVPGIGLKRGLLNELVISPYSTIIALPFCFSDGITNLKRLTNEGLEGRYGFYEAIDYTRERSLKGKKKSIIKSYMIHHQGMSLMALDNVLNNNILQNRFHNIPMVKATELLLQEKVPKRIIYDREQQFEAISNGVEKQNNIVRKFNGSFSKLPETQILSNGSYSLMVTDSGSGYGKVDDISLYRWKEDITLNCSGMFFYIKNINSNEYWSATYQPCRNRGDEYEVNFSADKAEFKRRDGNLFTHTEITVSNEDNVEVRRLSITNHSIHPRTVEVTSYCEITLATYTADIVHPAFSNLFIATRYFDKNGCVAAYRRQRGKDEKERWIFQTTAVLGETIGTGQYETNRMNFIGRNRSLEDPAAMENDTVLTNSTGNVIDPIISIRKRVRIKPGQTVVLAYSTGMASSEEQVLELSSKYKEFQNINRAFELAWTQNEVLMKYLGIKSAQANLYQSLSSRVLFINPQFQERCGFIKNISTGQRGLWPYGVSGDLPIVLLMVRDEAGIDLLKQLLSIHQYWNLKGITVDLVVLNLQEEYYYESLNNTLEDIISSGYGRERQNKKGGIFLFSKHRVKEDFIILLQAIASIVVDSKNGHLLGQIKKYKNEKVIDSIKAVEKEPLAYSIKKDFDNVVMEELTFYNSFGGFDLNKNEYVILLKDGKTTPLPWINVIANEKFGFNVSEAGSAYTWNKNSRENKLTVWSNDPVMDTPSEMLYLKDKNTNRIWSITPSPLRDAGSYLIEHGYGYSNFTHEAFGIKGKITMFVPLKESVKIIIVRLENYSKEVRELNLAYFGEMVLGVSPEFTASHITTCISLEKKLIYAENQYNEHFSKQKVYLKIGGSNPSFTGNRMEFIGREGSIKTPIALSRDKLSNACGSGFDPCLAVEVEAKLLPGEKKCFIILLGAEDELSELDRVVSKYESLETCEQELEEIKHYWSKLLNGIQVKTPDKSMDIMLNGYLLYQTLSCRILSRSAFYQSGGAYGFRDQLQDVLALSYVKPEITRKQILLAASRQYVEGDVQHWWHPIINSGIKTRFSDDLLWLPYVTSEYIAATGDYGILQERVGYIFDEPLKEGEDERYSIVDKMKGEGSIYEHCIKAIERALKFGSHNIPLMGSGDWNDGMNTVGNKGKGESVWLGWFLYKVLKQFIPLCEYEKDYANVPLYTNYCDFIKTNLEENAWDGGWYRRAYFDDGTPLGSSENEECQIDSISQSWAVISGAASAHRRTEAMKALENQLVKRGNGMILLLYPPFDKSDLEPGYIKGYIPGVRENGGQYTHAAIWTIMAEALLGEGDKAWFMYNMINPINHTKSYLDCERYKVEPYVMAADIYGKEPNIGRGGWSWYTGAAGWMYRVGIENLLGFKLQEGKGFTVKPCIPGEWKGYEMIYNKDNSKYNIKIERGKESKITLNGFVLKEDMIPFQGEGIHNVTVTIL